MKVIRIILTLSLCNIAVTSNAMLVRAVQPIAKRIASRLFIPKVPAQIPTIKHTLQLPAQAVKMPSVKLTSSFNSRSTQGMKLFKARPNYHRYYNNKSKWIFPAALGMGALATSGLQDHASTEPASANQPKPWAEVEERYRKELAAEEQAIMKEFQKLLGFSPEEWEQEKLKKAKKHSEFLEELAQEEIRQHPTPVSPELKNTVIRLLQQEGIDPAIVTIVNRPHAGAVFSLKGGLLEKKVILYIDEALYYSTNVYKTALELEATMLHEIQHIKYSDDLMVRLSVQGPKGIPFNRLQVKYCVFAEKRADILAGLASPEYAKARVDSLTAIWNLYSWYEKLLHALRIKNISADDGTHPPIARRISYMTQLHQEMHACVQQEKRSL